MLSLPRFLHSSPRQMNIYAVLLSAAAFYINSACVSWAKHHTALTTGYFTVGRSLLGALLALLLIGTARKVARPREVKSLCLRGLANFVALITFFEATSRLGPSLGNLLNLTYPLFLAFMALRNRSDPAHLLGTTLAAVIAFAGIALILNPTSTTQLEPLGVLLGLVSGATGALAVASLKKARSVNSPETILLFLFGLSLPLSLLFFGKDLFVPSGLEFAVLFGGSLAGIIGQYLFSFGAEHLSATESGIISQSRIVISAVAGQLLMLEPQLGALQITGITLISLVNVYLLVRR